MEETEEDARGVVWMMIKIGHYEIDDKTHAVEVYAPPHLRYLVSTKDEYEEAIRCISTTGAGFSTRVVHLDGV